MYIFIRNVLIIFVAIMVVNSYASEDIRLDCNTRNSQVDIDMDLNRIGFSNMEITNYRTGFYSFIYLRETNFGCTVRDVCFEGTNRFFRYKAFVPSRLFNPSQIRFSTVRMEIRDRRNGRRIVDFLRCRKI